MLLERLTPNHPDDAHDAQSAALDVPFAAGAVALDAHLDAPAASASERLPADASGAPDAAPGGSAQPGKTAITVLLVDDHPALRAGLASLLAGEAGIAVTGQAVDGETAYAAYRALRPDVVVLDLAMPGFGGLECLRKIVAFDPQARVLVFTVYTSHTMLARALDLGALGYVTKGNDVEVLIRALREVAQDRGFVSPDMVPAMVRKRRSTGPALPEQLGDREFQIFLLTAQGHKPAECAALLNVSEKTVRNHLTRIKTRLGVSDTAQLLRLAIRAGLVDP